MTAISITPQHLARWRENPALFIEEVCHDPETKKPFKLLPAERAFLKHCFKKDKQGRLLYPELLYGAPKKSGKTAFAALLILAAILLYGGAYPEAVCAANNEEQATARVFRTITRIIECSPVLRKEARIKRDRIEFPSLHATIGAISSEYSSAAGGNQNISCFDELWAYSSESDRRLFDELVPPPTRKIACRLTVTYAGFEGESHLLQEMYKQGLQQPQIGKDLHAGNGLLMFWAHEFVAPWQTEAWREQMRRSLRPNQYLRMIENRFVSTETTFIDMEWWDECVDPDARPIVSARHTPVWVGVDASTKKDSTAVVAVTVDPNTKKVRLLHHRIFQPSSREPLNFEATIEQTLLFYHSRFSLREVRYDPMQMASVAQRMTARGVPMVEYPQSMPKLTHATQNLYDLIKSRRLVLYEDAAMRLAAQRCIAVESARGWKIAKEKQSHKIDVIVALGMAALGAELTDGMWFDLSAANNIIKQSFAQARMASGSYQPSPMR